MLAWRGHGRFRHHVPPLLLPLGAVNGFDDRQAGGLYAGGVEARAWNNVGVLQQDLAYLAGFLIAAQALLLDGVLRGGSAAEGISARVLRS